MHVFVQQLETHKHGLINTYHTVYLNPTDGKPIFTEGLGMMCTSMRMAAIVQDTSGIVVPLYMRIIAIPYKRHDLDILFC